MLSKRDIERAINECESSISSYDDCKKLATFYAIYDHLYSEDAVNQSEEIFVGDYGDSDFLKAISGKSAERMWRIVDELVEAIIVTNPRLYDGVMRKVAE